MDRALKMILKVDTGSSLHALSRSSSSRGPETTPSSSVNRSTRASPVERWARSEFSVNILFCMSRVCPVVGAACWDSKPFMKGWPFSKVFVWLLPARTSFAAASAVFAIVMSVLSIVMLLRSSLTSALVDMSETREVSASATVRSPSVLNAAVDSAATFCLTSSRRKASNS